MTSEAIRQSFLQFFKEKNHHIVPSCSLLPEAPNLLFTNAGMNPFVPYFLGERKPPYLRVADTQKCIRAGGKHNDLEEVGFDTYHHTFFEMLGNWSFGDFFKKEAIEWAWELLTHVWGFPKERLYATVYKPLPGEPANFDEEAYSYWKDIFEKEGLDPAVHVVTGSKKDNFWMMGDTGPCGPCSEIHIDLTPNGDSRGKLVNAGDVRCIEVWNLVFMQYNALPDGQLELLKDKFVDTGMGFERVAGILATTKNFSDFSNVPSNYDSDLFTPIFDALEKISGHHYQRSVPSSPHSQNKIEIADCAFRIIADHIRTLTFAIADGILPGNEGRNYVLRRIIRRAILFGQKLGLKTGFFADLSTVIAQNMKHVFPELEQHAATIKKVLLKEEEAFNATLSRGLHLFERWINEKPSMLTGDKVFLLYDTYGFPMDLTQLLAREHNISVDIEGFNTAMQQQKERSKSAQKKSVIQLSTENKETQFVGYNEANLSQLETRLIAIEQQADKAFIVTESSPFYGEKGGQIGDTGWVVCNDRRIEITDTIWQQGTLLHQINVRDLPFLQSHLHQTIFLSVDQERRKSISRHHTATHLLHWALRKVVGEHVHQAGSHVDANSLRFDFSHFEKLTLEQLRSIEALCNEKILRNDNVFVEEVDFDKKPKECLAFFEDKYGDRVRVVHLGDYSTELCGGTHVKATGELGQFRILQETAVASGVRRIEAIAGIPAYHYAVKTTQQIQQIESQFACPLDKIYTKYQQLMEQKAASDTRYQQLLQKNSDHIVLKQTICHEMKCVQFQMQSIDSNTLRNLCKNYLTKNGVDVLLAASEIDQKVVVLAFCSPKAIQKNLSAQVLIQKILTPLGAKGGGKPDFATGGIKNVPAFTSYWTNLSFDL